MTLARTALSWLGWKIAARESPEIKSSEPVDAMMPLDRVLQIHVVRHGEVKIFTQEMGPRSLLFRSATGFELGETVVMRLLLRADLILRLTGTIRWLHEGSRGLSGQIDFEPTAEQEAQLAAYLELRRR